MATIQTLYSFDTSALIDGIERYYPIANFPALWERMDELIAEGRLLVSEEAWNEAVSAAAALKEWCTEDGCNRESCVEPTSAAIAAVAGAIVSQFPKWITQGKKNGADPFVIAVAEVRDCTVISGETNGGPGKPKIPYVCKERSVDHGRITDVVVAEGWVFG